MATTYTTRDGDMLDAVCWAWYGNADNVPAVLNANPGLAEYGTHFPAGIVILLPDITPEPTYTTSLWD